MSRATIVSGTGRCAIVAGALFLFASPYVHAQHSAARQWNDELLEAIRHDFARPTIHARNLFHVSGAMWDAWAAYDSVAHTYLHHEVATAPDVEAARAEAISFASYRILSARFVNSPGSVQALAAFDALMDSLGYDKTNTSAVGDTPAALGNRIAATWLAFGLTDNANEANGYANQSYEPINPPLVPALPGNPDIIDPLRWQPLALDYFIDQGGNVKIGGYPDFLSPEWGQVSAFALRPQDLNIYQRDGFDYWVFHDPGAPPHINGVGDHYYRWGFELVAIWGSHLDPNDGVMWDVSPNTIGNAPLADTSDFENFYDLVNGGDASLGYAVNPITGQPYAPQIVHRGNYARILAEFWADGPASETPPGHWFVIANYVSDHPDTVKQLRGKGPVLTDLEWDVKLYFALAGTVHDAAVAVWGIKGWYDYIRPVSAIRYMADRGQSSDPNQPSYDPNGIRLYPGLIEVVTPATTAAGQRHAHLAGYEGKIALNSWRGPAYIIDPATDAAGVGWILAENWWPYQRPSFVTPPFAGYTSGHSSFSRSAAVLMGHFTGSEYFPGGLGIFDCPQNEFLVFEDGPSENVELQWAKYLDASDQCSLSRIWGGIHPPADDLPGRHIGNEIGVDAFDLALEYFGITAGDYDGDGDVDLNDASAFMLCYNGPNQAPAATCPAGVTADYDHDGDVDLHDFAQFSLNFTGAQ